MWWGEGADTEWDILEGEVGIRVDFDPALSRGNRGFQGHRGGMYFELDSLSNQQTVIVSWVLVAMSGLL